MPKTDRPTVPIENCDHGTRHYHGTRMGYRSHKCRCEDCREAKSRYRGKRPASDIPAELEHFDFRTELPAWHLDAACRGMDIALFFPGKGEKHLSNRAKEICAGCPVRAECLEWAVVNNEPGGVWGGTTERGRRRIRSLAEAGSLGEVDSASVREAV